MVVKRESKKAVDIARFFDAYNGIRTFDLIKAILRRRVVHCLYKGSENSLNYHSPRNHPRGRIVFSKNRLPNDPFQLSSLILCSYFSFSSGKFFFFNISSFILSQTLL